MLKKNLWGLIVLCLVVVFSCPNAFAWWNGAHRHGVHYNQGGKWYKHNWVWFDAAVTALTAGAIVESLPPRSQTIVVGGVPYYSSDNVYYRQGPQGYIVVPAPGR
jgi:hypothetical protein